MARATLFGATYSVYVRIVRLVLEEAGVPYDLVEVDVFEPETLIGGWLERHPFGKIPAFEHEGFFLYESDAIAHYVIDAFEDRTLLPEAPREAARCRQIMRIMDNYAYPALVWGIFVPETDAEDPTPADDESLEEARTILNVLDELMAGPFMLGAEVSPADLWALPMIAYFDIAPSGRALMDEFPRLRAWLQVMNERPSVRETKFPREREAADPA